MELPRYTPSAHSPRYADVSNIAGEVPSLGVRTPMVCPRYAGQANHELALAGCKRVQAPKRNKTAGVRRPQKRSSCPRQLKCVDCFPFCCGLSRA